MFTLYIANWLDRRRKSGKTSVRIISLVTRNRTRVTVKLALEQATKVKRGSRGIALLFL